MMNAVVFRRLLFLAGRNIFRNKRRSLLSLAILIMGSAGLILVGGFFANVMEGFREVFIHSQTGHLQINADGYYEKGASSPFKYLMGDVERVRQEIAKNPEVLYTVPRLKFGGMVSSDETNIAVMAIGVDPILERRMGSYRTSERNAPSMNILEGQDLDPADPYGAVLGKGLMKALGLRVGDSINFITTRQEGALDGAVYHVRGTFQTFVKDFDDRIMKMNLESAQKLLNLPDKVHSLLVVLQETDKTDKIRNDLRQAFRERKWDLELITWEEQGDYYRQGKKMLDQIFATVQLIISVIFLLSIANTINMALTERMREFGTMMALGNSRGTIFMTIFLEAAFLAVLGSLLGLVVGSGISQIVSAIGIRITPPQATADYICTISLSPKLLASTFAISTVSTLISSIIPGYRASHFQITRALGYV